MSRYEDEEADAPGAAGAVGGPGERLHYGSRDPAVGMRVAQDPGASHEALLSVAPASYARDASPELVIAILNHPACSPSLAGRYATHESVEVRCAVAMYPADMNAPTLLVLSCDADEETSRTATERLAEQEANIKRFG